MVAGCIGSDVTSPTYHVHSQYQQYTSPKALVPELRRTGSTLERYVQRTRDLHRQVEPFLLLPVGLSLSDALVVYAYSTCHLMYSICVRYDAFVIVLFSVTAE